jgi:hypothetical protein
MLFFYHFGATWAPPNGPIKVVKGRQVGCGGYFQFGVQMFMLSPSEAQ